MIKKVVAFGTHPDDIELGCGGALALLIARGAEVVHVCLTSGESGSQTVSPAALKLIREKEAKAAAAALGSKAVRFLGFPDGLLHVTREMKLPLMEIIRREKPDTNFTHSRTDEFPDHKVACELILSAILAASGPWYQEVTLPPHQTTHIYGYEVWHPIAEPQMMVDITSVLDKKRAAVNCFKSQLADVSYDDAWEGLARYRGALSRVGECAEAFEVIRQGLG